MGEGERICHAAVDLGASSGRVLLGWLEEDGIRLEEVHRFANTQRRVDGHDCWDIDGLFEQILVGLGKCKSELGAEPATVGIDTWAVDYVLLDADDRRIGECVAYRDGRTDGVPELVDRMIARDELYGATGIQLQKFNTLYQLVAQGREHPEQLAAAQAFLMVPDYLNWRLTGKKANEYTNASSTNLLDAAACDWDAHVLAACGIPTGIFQMPSMPGTCLGPVSAAVAERIGYAPEVVLVASHDTGSAFLAVPAKDERSVFLSSGTWSLLGCETPEPVLTPEAHAANFTNEGGYDRRYRFLKNIMGLWMIQSVRRELNGVDYVEGRGSAVHKGDHEYGFGELSQLAREAAFFEAYVDVNDGRFLSPESMIDEVKAACAESGQAVPTTVGELMRVLYLSLARAYRLAVAELAQICGHGFDRVNIVGGGCQDAYLNELTAAACGLPVLAGPVEGTGIGNLLAQLIYAGEVAGVEEGRALVARSFEVKTYEP